MANNIWSESIQGILNLDLSRELRFRDDRKELFMNLLGLDEGMTAVDIGCGPGALTRKLAKWLGVKSKIIGIDRDTNFISYAKDKAVENGLYNISYYEGDALDLPLGDNSVDACISHTVIEHVPNKEFLLEQKRICRPNGRVSVMFARPDKYIKTEPEKLPKQSRREIELLEKLFESTDEINKKYSVGKYWPDPVALPKLFEELGFNDIRIDAAAIPVVIDDGRNSEKESIAMITSEREQMLEGISMGLCLNKNALANDEVVELRQIISERFEERIGYVKEGIKIWDYSILIMQIVSGRV